MSNSDSPSISPRMGETLLTVEQAAQEIGVSPVQVTRYCRNGLLACVEEGKAGQGMSRRIPLSAVRAFTRPKRGPKGKRNKKGAQE